MSRKKIKISKSEYPIIEKLASQGMSVSLIADYFGISKATLERRISECIELSEALKRGRSRGIDNVTSVAYQMAISGKCPAMTIFWLKCQALWKEKIEKDEQENHQPVQIVFTRKSDKI